MKQEKTRRVLINKQDFMEKTKNWMKEQCYQEFAGGPLESLIPDELIEESRSHCMGHQPR